MKLLLIYHGGGRGGDATVCFDLLKAFEKLGHQVDFYAHIFEEEAFRSRLNQRNIKCEIVPKLSMLPQLLKKVADNYDAVHFHTANEWPLFNIEAIPLIRTFPKQKLFCTVHGSRSLLELCKNRRYRLSAKLAIRCFKEVVVPSQHKARDWVTLLGRAANIVRIQNPVEPLPYLTKEVARQKLGVGPNRKVVSFVGILRSEKGIVELIESAKDPRFTDWTFLVAGNGELLEYCEEQISKHRLPVNLLGYQQDPSIVYRAADIFCFPSVQENYPIALFQSVVAGIPTVASDIPVVMDELQFPGAVFIFKAGNSDSLADCLLEADVRMSADRCLEMSTLVKANHDCVEVAKKYVALFDKTVGSPT